VKPLLDADAAQLVYSVFEIKHLPGLCLCMNGMYHARHLLGQPQADFGLPHFMAVASLMQWYDRMMHILVETFTCRVWFTLDVMSPECV